MTKPSYTALFYFLGRYKLLYGTILLLTVVSSLMESFGVVAFFPVFSSILGDQQDTGGLLGLVSDAAGLFPFSDPIVAASVLLICIIAVKTVLTLLRETMTAYASAKVLYDTKRQIMDTYAGAQYQFFLDSRQGNLIFNVLSAPYAVGTVLLKAPQFVAFLLKMLSVAVVLAIVFPMAAGAFAVLGVVYYAVIHYLSRKVSFSLGQGKADAGTEQTVIANEFLSGIRQISTLRSLRHWTQRFDLQNRSFSNLHAKELAWLAAPRPVMELFAVGLMLLFVVLLRVLSSNTTFTEVLPRLGIFAVALAQLLPSLTALGRTRMELMGAIPESELAYRSIVEPPPKRKDGEVVLGSFDRALAFEKVSFSHKGRDALLDEIDLTFEKGKVTAIVGPSGSGKTTIINLILGLFEPTWGNITVDGVPLQALKLDSWLSKVGFVSQDPFTYHATVAENVLFGRNGHSMESVVAAMKIANAHDFVSELREGYDTIVGDRGMKLSGGQQQRIAIARAVLNSPEILIFDEATSSLDTLSEKLVQEAMDKVSSDRTVIVVAHRLSTIRQADKIIVLDNGRVVEEGDHHSLLSRDGHYSRLVASGT